MNLLNRPLTEEQQRALVDAALTQPKSRLAEAFTDKFVSAYQAGLSEDSAKKVVNVKRRLTELQIEKLKNDYPEYNVKSTNTCDGTHSMAACYRKLETQLLLDMTDPSRPVDDIGGNWVTHVLAGRENVFSCCPILGDRDAKRHADRRFRFKKTLGGMTTVSPALNAMVEELKSTPDGPNKHYCHHKFQDCTCNRGCEQAIAVHSVYDIPLQELVDAMARRGTQQLFGCFLFSVESLLDVTSGQLEHAEGYFEKDGDVITYFFDGDPNHGYQHSFNLLSQYLKKTYIQSGDRSYFLELTCVRGDTFFFSIADITCAQLSHTRETIVKRLPLPLKQKVVVPLYSVDKSGLVVRKDYPLPKDFVNRIVEYAARNNEGALNEANLISYMASTNHKVVVNGSAVRGAETINPVLISSLATTFILRERFDRSVQQKVKEHLRSRMNVDLNIKDILKGVFEEIFGRVSISQRVLRNVADYVGYEYGESLVNLAEPLKFVEINDKVRHWFTEASEDNFDCIDTTQPLQEYLDRLEEAENVTKEVLFPNRKSNEVSDKKELKKTVKNQGSCHDDQNVSVGPVVRVSQIKTWVDSDTFFVDKRGIKFQWKCLLIPFKEAADVIMNNVFEADVPVVDDDIDCTYEGGTLTGLKIYDGYLTSDGSISDSYEETDCSDDSDSSQDDSDSDNSSESESSDSESDESSSEESSDSESSDSEDESSDDSDSEENAEIDREVDEGDKTEKLHDSEIKETEVVETVPDAVSCVPRKLSFKDNFPIIGNGVARNNLPQRPEYPSDDYATASILEFLWYLQCKVYADRSSLMDLVRDYNLGLLLDFKGTHPRGVGVFRVGEGWIIRPNCYTHKYAVVFRGDEARIINISWDEKAKRPKVTDLLGETILVCDTTYLMQEWEMYNNLVKMFLKDGLQSKSKIVCYDTSEKMKNGVKITLVDGVPGCGKSTEIVEKADPNRQVILSMGREAADDLRSRFKKKKNPASDENLRKRVRTVDSFLLHCTDTNAKSAMRAEILHFDEALMAHAGMVYCCAKILRAKSIVCQGDSKQIPFINRIQQIGELRYSKLKIDHTVKKRTTYRCPVDVAYVLSKHYGENVMSASKVVRSMQVKSIATIDGVPKRENTHYLTFLRAEKESLMDKGYGRINGTMISTLSEYISSVSTVHEAQGKTFKNVILVRGKRMDDEIFKSMPHVIVSISRHTETLMYCSVVQDKIWDDIVAVQQTLESVLIKHSIHEGNK